MVCHILSTTTMSSVRGMIDNIPSLDDRVLYSIEQKTSRLMKIGNDKQRAYAEKVLLAIIAERRRRKDAAAENRNLAAAEFADEARDKGLFDRVLLAFTEVPPQQEELEVLREIASRPDRDGTTIAHAMGNRGVDHLIRVIETLCSTREAYLDLAPVPKRRSDELNYFGLLIDFALHVTSRESRWFGWTLKLDAYAALKQLGIVD
jgi:hypothetical protein